MLRLLPLHLPLCALGVRSQKSNAVVEAGWAALLREGGASRGGLVSASYYTLRILVNSA